MPGTGNAVSNPAVIKLHGTRGRRKAQAWEEAENLDVSAHEHELKSQLRPSLEFNLQKLQQ